MANNFDITTNPSGLLKNYYGPGIISQFNDMTPLYSSMEKGAEKYTGAQVVRALKVRRLQSIGAVSEGGNLPAIGRQTVVNAQINAKYLYCRPGISAQMIAASKNDRGAFANDFSYIMEQSVIDLQQDFSRQLFWDGTGTLATVSANAVSSAVITATGRTSGEPGNKYLDVGSIIDIISGSTVVASGISVTAISGSTTATLTLSAPVTTTANDIIVRAGSYNIEVQGLLTSLDGGTTTIFNIDRSAYPVYQGNVINASSGQLTLNLMQQAFNEARRRGNGKVSDIYCDYDSERFYTRLLVADKRYLGAKVEGDGSFSTKEGNMLSFGGAPIHPDKDCTNDFYFLDMSTWKRYELGEFLSFANESGSEMIPQTTADLFELRLRGWTNIFPEKPSANARLKSYISP